MNLPPLLDIAENTIGERVVQTKQSIIRFLTTHFPRAATLFEQEASEEVVARPPSAVLAHEWRVVHPLSEPEPVTFADRASAAVRSAAEKANAGLQSLYSAFHRLVNDEAPDPMKNFSFHTARCVLLQLVLLSFPLVPCARCQRN